MAASTLKILYFILIVGVSSILWRIRGGLWKDKIPANKIWYSLFFASLNSLFFAATLQNFVIGFLACYVSYQLYGWGLYIGRLVHPQPLDPAKDKECELIDDILYSCRLTLKGNTVYLYQYPQLFGFCGTTLTGLIITFLWGLYLSSILVMLSGLGMGACYWLGYLINKRFPEPKLGWGYGEYISGAYSGIVLAIYFL